MEFPETGVPKLGSMAPDLKSLEIRECTSQEPLIVSPDIFKGLEGKLLNVTFHSCNLMVGFSLFGVINCIGGS